MFNSGIIDVAIGMVFVYLLLSLIASAVGEAMELWLKNRATDLERGIRELLLPGGDANAPDFIKQLYNHPLINGLFPGKYEDSGINKARRFFNRTKLPSYIPSRNFALALMDLAVPAEVGKSSGAAGAVPPIFDVTLQTPPPPPVEIIGAHSPLQALRDGLLAGKSVIPEQAGKGLLALIDAAGNDAAKARENIENWYNSSMDRVSGWYKRRAQIFILIIGIVLSFALNADSVMIAKRLVADKSLRETLSVAAQEYAKKNAEVSTSTSANPPKTEDSPIDSRRICQPPPLSCKNPDSPQCKLDKSLCDLDSLGLPIGWDAKDDPRRSWPGTNFFQANGWTDQVYWHLVGWLITAMAISLGAPFWFDMLNKIIVVRSTVKPHEKSKEEGSK